MIKINVGFGPEVVEILIDVTVSAAGSRASGVKDRPSKILCKSKRKSKRPTKENNLQK